ncbi:SIMPL domain-containing protein [Aquimarina sp. W85]|uniref:SIMPL domain-containing protein n=1 Tax=Aquimarina rhodophyticola TaxID=3342246 RepID=UPI003671F604
MKKQLTAIIFAVAIIIASFVLGKAYVDRNAKEGEILVTGLGKANFSSDLIVWEGRFEAQNIDLKQAYVNLEKDKNIIENYLISQGISKDDLVFSAVKTTRKTRTKYAPNGNYIGEEFDGYLLAQAIEIESKEVAKVELISREVTKLLNQGVQLYSEAPRYYYTKLADLKIEMISKATEDARLRAEKIAENSGGKLGKLKSARMGVFQITGQNSTESYSWGGTFNTIDKEKTASITMKLVYDVD